MSKPKDKEPTEQELLCALEILVEKYQLACRREVYALSEYIHHKIKLDGSYGALKDPVMYNGVPASEMALCKAAVDATSFVKYAEALMNASQDMFAARQQLSNFLLMYRGKLPVAELLKRMTDGPDNTIEVEVDSAR